MFKIYAFNRYGYEIDEKAAIRETSAMFITPAKQFYPKGERILKITSDYTWRLSRKEAINDGIGYLKAKHDSLKDGLSKVKHALDRLEREDDDA